MKKVCQSCGMPLFKGQADFRGTELDGSRTDKFCNRCYLNGKYQDDNLTVEKLIEISTNEIDKSDMSKMKKWMMKKSLPMYISKLDRWKK